MVCRICGKELTSEGFCEVCDRGLINASYGRIMPLAVYEDEPKKESLLGKMSFWASMVSVFVLFFFTSFYLTKVGLKGVGKLQSNLHLAFNISSVSSFVGVLMSVAAIFQKDRIQRYSLVGAFINAVVLIVGFIFLNS